MQLCWAIVYKESSNDLAVHNNRLKEADDLTPNRHVANVHLHADSKISWENALWFTTPYGGRPKWIYMTVDDVDEFKDARDDVGEDEDVDNNVDDDDDPANLNYEDEIDDGSRWRCKWRLTTI